MTWFYGLIGRMFNLENVQKIDHVELSFAAEWAHNNRAWVLFGAIGLTALALTFYLRHQPRTRKRFRLVLGIVRAMTLVLLLLVLADPVGVFKLTSQPRPLIYVLIDGTDSMGIQDELSDQQRAKLAQALGIDASSANMKLSRNDYVRALVSQKDKNVLARLEEKYRIKAFRFDQPEKGVTEIQLNDPATEKLDAALALPQLTTDGQVTAIGRAFEELAQRHSSASLGGVIVLSDFGQNTGVPPVGGSAQSPSKRLGVPVYTVGIGPKAAIDVAVDLQAPLLMKKGERSSLTALVRQNGLNDHHVEVKLSSRRLSGSDIPAADEWKPLKTQPLDLTGPNENVDFAFTPNEVGRFEFRAEIDPQEGEVVTQNNRSSREVNIRDDFLRLMYVEYEPTWEWRFIKEVFHRDKLVGQRGFRTFLRSSDPKVRQSNELFLKTMTPDRKDFFANDVIFLGDMPGTAISPRFAEMTKEFVSKFGGGLVVIAGPRFGPGQLAGTPIADMLPVVVDSSLHVKDQNEFMLQLTPAAMQYDFMRLGDDTEAEHKKAWANLGKLPWYQPVARVHPLASVLAEHPSDLCSDGKTHQPLIAIRRFGKGQVVYLGFDETWRLRRKYGETYFRQFWAQMIHRLGLSHAIGTQKRFVVRTDQQQYKEDDKVILTVEAYDANFEPLTEDKLPDHKLMGEMVSPGRAEGTNDTRAITIPQLQSGDTSAKGAADKSVDRHEGIFETKIPVVTGGEHRIRVKDPITGDVNEVTFQVTNLSVERRSAVRNIELEQQIAAETGGKSYELETVSSLPDEIKLAPVTETNVHVVSLSSTWLCFGLAMALMMGEWATRKLINLP